MRRVITISSEISDREHQGSGFRYPNGAAYTTLRDFAHFASFALGLGPETVLKTGNMEAMFAEKLESGNGFQYGRGKYRKNKRGCCYIPDSIWFKVVRIRRHAGAIDNKL